MLSFTGSLKIFIALEPVDLRAGINTLHALVADRLKEDSRRGALFVFTNKRRKLIKILCWDGTGMWLLMKRLEEGTFFWPRAAEEGQVKLELKPEAFAMLTDGIDMHGARPRGWYERSDGR
jgi:transposase